MKYYHRHKVGSMSYFVESYQIPQNILFMPVFVFKMNLIIHFKYYNYILKTSRNLDQDKKYSYSSILFLIFILSAKVLHLLRQLNYLSKKF